MKIYSTYSVKILGRNRIFRETAAAYRSAVDFFIGISLKEWGSISRLKGLRRNNEVEKYTIKTKKRPEVPYDFSKDFYKFPSYLRRAAIAEALAYDGSGYVDRGVNGNYSLCRFQNGKEYHCDLNASYNIGARYFIREILKSLPETERLGIGAKVPGCTRRSTCTLSTLYDLHAAIAVELPVTERRPKGGEEVLSA